jgi:RNA polymerase sigma-70 factor (ECF subfamily)
MTADDRQAFRRIFDAYLDPLRRFVFTYVGSWETAEEVVNDAFLQLWLRERDEARSEPVRDVKAYLFTAARNRAVSLLRRQRLELRYMREVLEPELRAGGHARPPDADDLLVTADLAAALQEAVDALPSRQREIILLRWQHGATQEEIGHALGIDAKTVSTHYRRALARLRGLLPSFFGDPT